MKSTLIAVLLAATALSGSIAQAQPYLGRVPPAGGQQGQGDRGRVGQNQPQQQAQPQRQPQAQPQPQRQPPAPPQRQAQQPDQRNDRAGPQGQWQGGGGQRGRGGFSYGGRQHDQIQRGGFNYPRGYSYRRWGAGQILPFLFLTSPYIFDSYNDYGIGPPPRGYRWVRYGPDLLLVSRTTGRIRQVIYGVFY